MPQPTFSIICCSWPRSIVGVERNSMYLNTLSPLKASVGYGQRGRPARLGYEGKLVQVRGVGLRAQTSIMDINSITLLEMPMLEPPFEIISCSWSGLI